MSETIFIKDEFKICCVQKIKCREYTLHKLDYGTMFNVGVRIKQSEVIDILLNEIEDLKEEIEELNILLHTKVKKSSVNQCEGIKI